MREIKYQPLKSNEDDLNSGQFVNESENICNIKECRKHWLFKVLFICFIVIKVIYIINNYDRFINWLQSHEKNYNQTETYENITDINSEELTTINYDNLQYLYKNENNNNSTTELNKNDIILIKTTKVYENAYITNSTSIPNIATTNYYVNTNKNSSQNGFTIAYNKTNNNYKDFVLTTLNTKNIFNDDFSTTTIINNFNDENKIITTEKTITQNYLNNQTLQTTIIVTDPSLTTMNSTTTTTAISIPIITTTTTTKRPMTASPIKTPAVRPYSPEDEQKYFINTSHCHIPFVDPFSPEIHKMFKPHRSTDCSKEQPIITASFNESLAQYILHINHKVAESLRKYNSKIAKPIEEDLLCCYQEVIRSGSGSNVDSSFK